MTRRGLLMAAAAIFAALAAGNARQALADDDGAPIGRIEASAGDVLVMRISGARVVGVGDVVREQDRIVTGTDGRVRVGFDDGSVLSVGSDTEILLSRYPGDGTEPGFFELLIGIVRTTLSKRDREPGFEIRARTAVATVRSTDWFVETNAETTAVFVAEGRVAVQANDADEEVVLDPGQGTDVPQGGAPSPVAAWGQKRIDDFVARTMTGN